MTLSYKMNMKLQNYQINDSLMEVGIIDDKDVPFHRLILDKGTTYNSYLYMTNKPTIIDTVDLIYTKPYIDNLKEMVDLSTIEYIVINHTEPDHSGSLASLVRQAEQSTIVCSEKAVYHLKELYKLHNHKFLIVHNEDTLDIGGKTLKFFDVPNLHTEETMITYCEDDIVLFSCDIFSTHVAAFEHAVSKAENDITEDYNLYYELIMSPHKTYIRDMLKFIKPLKIEFICPSHGYILDKQISKYIDIYDEKSKLFNNQKKIVIIYTTLRGTSGKVAKAFSDAFSQYENIDVSVYNADKTDHNIILEVVKDCDVLLIGSSTKYGDMVGSLEELLKKLPDLSGKIAGAFGTYGWSGEGVEIIHDYLLKTNAKVLNTSEFIKVTGTMHVIFPMRVRFNLNDKYYTQINNSVNYIRSLLID